MSSWAETLLCPAICRPYRPAQYCRNDVIEHPEQQKNIANNFKSFATSPLKFLYSRRFLLIIMKYVFQFLVIMVFAFVGEMLRYFIPLPVPASIYGIVLLFLALEFKVVKVSDIKETSNFLIAIMPLMFLPPAVGVIESWSLIRGAWLPYAVITLVSTVVVMGVSGRVTQSIIRRGGRK